MIVSAKRKAFGTSCVGCRINLIAPVRSTYVHDRLVNNDWYCECCDLTFTTSTGVTNEASVHLRECSTGDEKAAA